MSNIFVYLLYFLTHTAKMIYIYCREQRFNISDHIARKYVWEKETQYFKTHKSRVEQKADVKKKVDFLQWGKGNKFRDVHRVAIVWFYSMYLN